MSARPATIGAPGWRFVLIAIALLFIAFFLVVPLVAVFVEALSKGVEAYFAALVEPDAQAPFGRNARIVASLVSSRGPPIRSMQ